jgi:hypothetical protein
VRASWDAIAERTSGTLSGPDRAARCCHRAGVPLPRIWNARSHCHYGPRPQASPPGAITRGVRRFPHCPGSHSLIQSLGRAGRLSNYSERAYHLPIPGHAPLRELPRGVNILGCFRQVAAESGSPRGSRGFRGTYAAHLSRR